MGNENYKRLGGIIGVLEWVWMILGRMVASWCVLYLHDEYSWLEWLNREERKWYVIVRDGEWNGWTWIRWGGVSIDSYVWSAGREWLFEDEEKGVVEYWIWLECVDGCQWRRMELCGWGLRKNDDQGVFASESVDEERTKRLFLWLELNGRVVGVLQNAFLPSINMNRRRAEDFILHMKGMNGRVMWDGLVVVKEECDFSSVEREMKNGEWRDAESSWVEFGSRDPFPLLHAFSLPFFMIRGANNAYLPFWQKPSCFALNAEFKRQ